MYIIKLKEGKSVQLYHEDELMFLKDQFIFQVIAPFLGHNDKIEKDNEEVGHCSETGAEKLTSKSEELKKNDPSDVNNVSEDIPITPKPTGIF